MLDRFEHPWSIIKPFVGDFALARAGVSGKTPRCDAYIVSSFFFPELHPKASGPTRLVGPLLRREVSQIRPSCGDHVLVYQTSGKDPNLVPTLRSFPQVSFRVYGRPRPARLGNVHLRSFHEQTFLSDLAGARAVVSNGGFTAISEALFLGKPVLSIPLVHQGEQQLNASWLQALGLGLRASAITPGTLARFLDSLPRLRGCSDPRLRSGTDDALTVLDQTLREVA